MANMSLKRNEMPVIDAKKRSKCFEEVSLGYSKEQAIDEANRCLNCKNKPCVSGCPVNIDIPSFIEKIKDEKFEEAYKIIQLSSSLASICGRVCPQENQCEKHCIRAIKGESVGIGRLERFVADYHYVSKAENVYNITKNNHKVAVVGSGPSGLSCAAELAKMGYNVTILEALHVAGGVLIYGIPEFRLPKVIVSNEIEELKKMGVEVITNFVVGKSETIEELKNKYEAIFIGSGAGLPRFMNIPGENLNGVLSANEFLTRINLMKSYKSSSDTPINTYKNVFVIGGGNVAIDAARCALRMKADKVTILYRRSMAELPARHEEVIHAMEEGVEFKLLTNIKEIIGDDGNNVSKIRCVNMVLGEADDSGRRSPIEEKNSDFYLDADCVIMAIGTSPNPIISSSTRNLVVDRRGCIVVDEDTLQTSIDYCFAGGDTVTGAATVILAAGAGKKAAQSIDKYLKEKLNEI